MSVTAVIRGKIMPSGASSIDITPCFTPGTVIATPGGQAAIEELKVGDRVTTRDNGPQEIRWIGQRRFDGRQLAARPHLYPILVRAGAFRNELPERDMRLSPNHRVLVSSDQTALYFEEREVLVAAKHLVNNRGVFELESLGVTYIHILFDRHEVVMSNGSWTESFQPADNSLRGVGNAQRQDIYELFPELKRLRGRSLFRPARRILSRQEAERLSD